jgi:acetate kinase
MVRRFRGELLIHVSGGGFPVLSLNMGSSSLKFSLYMLRDRAEKLLADGEVERIGLPAGRVWARREGEIVEDKQGDFTKHKDAIKTIFDILDRLKLPKPAAAGHRIVHGGPEYSAPARVEEKLIEALRRLIPFAPLHLPAEIQVIEALAKHFPELPQVACFDTAFHRRMPEKAQRLPLSRALWDEGIRRYGFHGLSYEYIIGVLGKSAEGRVIVAHLGNGASMAAVRNREPLDTSMGFTPTGGFMMGTRSGDLDPGVILFLLTGKGYDADAIDRIVNREAGLLGVSGSSPDMKTLLERRERDPNAGLAVEMFCYQVRKQIGSFASVLGGLDTLAFTGGIGERAAPVRREICQGLRFLGIAIDPDRNDRNEDTISTRESGCVVRVIPTKEDLVIARHTRAVVTSE